MDVDKIDEIVHIYNNTYHITIKTRCVLDFGIENYGKDPKFNVGDHVKIKVFLQKAMYVPNWKEVFLIKNVKNTVPWTYVISDLDDEDIVGRFYEKE